jgi:hypothetical protein
MAIELFGADIGVYAAIACVASYLFSGHTGIYRSQRVGQGKHGGHGRYRRVPEGLRLGELAAWRSRQARGERDDA